MKIKIKSYLIPLSLTFFLLSCGSKFELLAGNEIKGFVDGGPVEAKFDNPGAMAVDDSGNLYVIDQVTSIGNDLERYKAIREITPDGKIFTIKKFENEESPIDSLKIKNNYLYFSTRTN